MILDRLVEQRLGDGRVIDFAVPVAAIADQVDHHVALPGVAIVERQAAHADHRVHIFRIHVKDRNRLPAGQLRRKTRGVLLAVQGGEAKQIVGDDVHRAAHGVALQVGQIQGLGHDALPREGRIAVDQQRQEFLDRRLRPARSCLARVRPTVTGSTASRWLGFETR